MGVTLNATSPSPNELGLVSDIVNGKATGGNTMDLKVKSAAFENGAMIPGKYTCDGADISPPLSWTSPGGNIASYAVICDDPDAPMGTWVHWVIFNIPSEILELPEDVPVKPALENGAVQGINDSKKNGYGGPCPPGGTHRYYFKVYALDTVLSLDAGATKKALLEAIEEHIIAQGQLMGKYKR